MLKSFVNLIDSRFVSAVASPSLVSLVAFSVFSKFGLSAMPKPGDFLAFYAVNRISASNWENPRASPTETGA